MRFVAVRRQRRQRRWRFTPSKVAGANHDLGTPPAIATGAPNVGAPALGQDHVLAATGIAAGAPSVGSPALAQDHALTATDIATSAPSVGAPAIGQDHALAAAGIAAAAPGADSPAFAQTHALAAQGVATSAPSAGAPALGGAAPPMFVDADDWDLPRTRSRKRSYEQRLGADIESAQRALRGEVAQQALQDSSVKPDASPGAGQAERAFNAIWNPGSDRWSPSIGWIPGSTFGRPGMTERKSVSAGRDALRAERAREKEEQDDEDALLLMC